MHKTYLLMRPAPETGIVHAGPGMDLTYAGQFTDQSFADVPAEIEKARQDGYVIIELVSYEEVSGITEVHMMGL